MHPEIVRDGPGTCPICGMALEPRTITAEPAEESRARRHDAAVLDRAALTVPLLLLAMGDMLAGQPSRRRCPAARACADRARAGDAGRALGRLAVLRARRGSRCVNRSLNMFTLIGLGVCVAYVYSVVAALCPALFPAVVPRRTTAQVGVYFEAAAVIVTLVLLGQVLELRARSQTGAAIRALLGLAPKTARRIAHDGSEEDVPLEQVQRRRPAARAAGREGAGRRRGRSKGTSAVDESMVTGEPMPVREAAGRPGDRRDGQRHRRARHARRARRRRHAARADRRAWSREAQRSRAPIQKLADVVSRLLRAGRRRDRGRRRSSSGRSSGPSRAWRTRSSTRSRC